MTLLRLLMLAVVMSLAACSSTVFVNLPEGEQSDCDERFVGDWRVSNADRDAPSSEQDEPDYLSVEAGCARIIGASVEDQTHEDLRDDTDVWFLSGKTQTYVVTRDKPDAPDADEDRDAQRRDLAYTLHRVRFTGTKRIELHEIDHARASDLLRAGKLFGTSKVTMPKKGNPTYDNVIDSEAADLTKALRDRRVFTRKPVMTLERVPASELQQRFNRIKGAKKDTPSE